MCRLHINKNKFSADVNTVCSRERDNSIDFARGIGVFLVIAGHMPSVFSESVRAWIFTFHMPLFILISGYFWKLVGSEAPKNYNGENPALGELKKGCNEAGNEPGKRENCASPDPSPEYHFRMLRIAGVRIKGSARSLLVPYVVYSAVFMVLDFLITGVTGVAIYSGESLAFGTGFHLQAASEQLARHLRSFVAGQGGANETLWFFVCLFFVRLFYMLAEMASCRLTAKYQEQVLAILAAIVTVIGWFCGRARLLGFWKIGSALYSVGYFAIGRGLRIIHQRDRRGALETRENRVPAKFLMVFTSCLAVNLLIFFASWKLTGNAGTLDINYNTSVDLIFTYIAAAAGSMAVIAFSRMMEVISLKHKEAMIETAIRRSGRTDQSDGTDPLKKAGVNHLRVVSITGILTYIGRNSLYFYPISDYIPGVVDVLLQGLLAKAGRLLAFLVPWAVAEMMGKNKKRTVQRTGM